MTEFDPSNLEHISLEYDDLDDDDFEDCEDDFLDHTSYLFEADYENWVGQQVDIHMESSWD